MCDSWPEHPQKVGTDHPARKNCKNEEPQKIHLNWLLCFSILQPMLQHTSANFLARFTRAVLLRCDLLLVWQLNWLVQEPQAIQHVKKTYIYICYVTQKTSSNYHLWTPGVLWHMYDNQACMYHAFLVCWTVLLNSKLLESLRWLESLPPVQYSIRSFPARISKFEFCCFLLVQILGKRFILWSIVMFDIVFTVYLDGTRTRWKSVMGW